MSEIVLPYNTEAKRVTVEQFGERGFGFLIEWDVLDNWADVKVWAQSGVTVPDDGSEGVVLYSSDGCGADLESTEGAEVYLEGYIKWDGCTELDMGRPHWCGPLDWQKHIALLEHIWRTAFELMGKPLRSQWECPLSELDRPKTPPTEGN